MLNIYSNNFAIDAYKDVDRNSKDPFLPPNTPPPARFRSPLPTESAPVNTFHLSESSYTMAAPPTDNSLLNHPEPPVPQFEDTPLVNQSPTLLDNFRIPDPPHMEDLLPEQADTPDLSSITHTPAIQNVAPSDTDLINDIINTDDVITAANISNESELGGIMPNNIHFSYYLFIYYIIGTQPAPYSHNIKFKEALRKWLQCGKSLRTTVPYGMDIVHICSCIMLTLGYHI